MKLSYLILSVMVLTGYNSYAQNIFPGPVGIGTNSPQYPLDVQHAGTGEAGAIVGLQGFVNTPGVGAYLRLIKSRGTTTGTFIPTLAGDGLGAVDFLGVKINNAIGYAARIVGYQDGTAGATYIPGKLSFFTGSNANAMSERMTITSSGNVGVGTSSPSYKFDVAGLLSSSLNGPSGLHLYNGGGVTEWLLQQKSQTDPNLYLSQLASGVQKDVFVVNPIGNIGFGTDALQAKFNIYKSEGLGSTPKNSSLLFTLSSSAGTGNNFQNNIWVVRNATGSDWYTVRLHDGISIDGSFLNPQANTLTWWERDPSQDIQSWGNAANTYLTISKGNVGIGQTNPQNKLDVNGIIHSKVVKIDLSGWSDYVFKKDYQLLSLSEVKAYIDQNQHLPEIPSEQEMIKNGLDVSAMNKLLMKKVEELTLYLIKKDEEKKEQQELLVRQQAQINQLIKQVEVLNNSLSKN